MKYSERKISQCILPFKHAKQKCFSVLGQKQSCSHEVKNGCKNLRFSFKPLKPFCLSSEQGLKLKKHAVFKKNLICKDLICLY